MPGAAPQAGGPRVHTRLLLTSAVDARGEQRQLHIPYVLVGQRIANGSKGSAAACHRARGLGASTLRSRATAGPAPSPPQRTQASHTHHMHAQSRGTQDDHLLAKSTTRYSHGSGWQLPAGSYRRKGGGGRGCRHKMQGVGQWECALGLQKGTEKRCLPRSAQAPQSAAKTAWPRNRDAPCPCKTTGQA